MNDTSTQENTSLVNVGAQAGMQKVGELFVSRALNALADGVKKAYGGSQVIFGKAFTRYLKNATCHYNQVHTIATGDITRTIIGPENIYVSIGVQYKDRKISTDTVDPMLGISKNILIQGTGGIGKSMMMRYLFLNTAHRGEHVPVLLELRKISRQAIGEISIIDLIFACLKDFDVELPREQFEFSLRLGKYLFLMDGFDEVKECMAAETAEKIQQFCSKYPNNPCIITSRPRRDTSPLQTFTTMKSMPLSKEQAVTLASKIWDEDEKTREFCRQLREELYDNERHREFVENPLLLTMMFLTFMRNNSLPNHLAEFYRQAFDALYSTHDSKNKGAYRREFECDMLDAPGFRQILSHFCFHSYRKQDYEFSEDELLIYLENSIKKFGYTEVAASKYFNDLKNVVCLIVKDGEKYRFAHRSFQTYFAACYTTGLNDDSQQSFFDRMLNDGEVCWEKADYYELLHQIEGKRFLINALEKNLHSIKNKAMKQQDPALWLFKVQFDAICLDEETAVGLHIVSDKYGRSCYNHIALFRRYAGKKFFSDNYVSKKTDEDYVQACMEKIIAIKHVRRPDGNVSFKKIESLAILSHDELKEFYLAVLRSRGMVEIISIVEAWLEEIDEERRKLKTADFMDDL